MSNFQIGYVKLDKIFVTVERSISTSTQPILTLNQSGNKGFQRTNCIAWKAVKSAESDVSVGWLPDYVRRYNNAIKEAFVTTIKHMVSPKND